MNRHLFFYVRNTPIHEHNGARQEIVSSELKLSDELRVCVKNTLFNHIDGISIGSTVFSLKKNNVFNILQTSRIPLDVNILSETIGAGKGFFQVALRLLAHQGFVRLSRGADTSQLKVSLTHNGRHWINFLDYYDQIPKISEMALNLKETLELQREDVEVDFFVPSIPSGLDHSSMAKRVRDHILGEITAVVMTELYLDPEMSLLLMTGKSASQNKYFSFDTRVWKFIIEILRANNWAKWDSDALSLSPSGLLALQWTPQYFYPVGYLSTFRKVPDLLFDHESEASSPPPTGLETHVDRRLDIKFSGIVYEKTCRNKLLEIVLPLFDCSPLEEQPESIVDTGSGDGTLLVDLFNTIREKTLRGRSLKSFPLAIIGAEYNQAARESTREALERAGINHAFAIRGDIGAPETLATDLSGIGVDPFNALHISKSVIHNRVYKTPGNTERLQVWKPLSAAPFVSTGGRQIDPREIECNLVELFENWKPFVHRHGMIVIEAHTVDPELTCPTLSQNIITCMDATHGYSAQYLMEYDAFLRSVRSAGYESRGYGALSGMSFGSPTLTINHFFPLKPQISV